MLQQILAVEDDPMKLPLGYCSLDLSALLPFPGKDRRNWLIDIEQNCKSTQMGPLSENWIPQGDWHYPGNAWGNCFNQEPFLPSSEGRKGIFSTGASNSGEQCSRSKVKQNETLSWTLKLPSQLLDIRQVVCSAGVKFAHVKSEHKQKDHKFSGNKKEECYLCLYAKVYKIQITLVLLLTSSDPGVALQAISVRGKANLLLWSC